MAYTANLIPAMTNYTAPSGVVSASGSYDANYLAWRAFDHVNVTNTNPWIAAAGTTGWLQYQFPTAHVVTRYAITTRATSGLAMTPKTWTFKGSNDGAAWTTLDTQTDITYWAALFNERKVMDIATTAAYAYYRLDITASNDASYLAVGELEMMADATYDAVLSSLIAIAAKTTNLPAVPAAVGSAMTLTSGERTSAASAVRTNLATELARIDENVSAAKTLTGGERTSISAAVSSLAIAETSDLPLGPWTRHGSVIPASQAYENGPFDHGLVAEPSVILNDHEWMAWYTTFGGIGHATAASPYGPWTKLPGLADLVDDDFTAMTLANGSFDSGSGAADAWMPQNWNLIETVAGTLGGTLKFNHVAGRTGGYALHVEYQATAGDAGKQILLYRAGSGAVAPGDTVRGSVYVKKTTFTGASMLIVAGDNLVPVGAGGTASVVPTTEWAQYEIRGKWFGLGVGPVQMRPFAITLTSDSAVVDILIDDAELSLSAVATNPVESDGQCSSVALVDGTFHMYYITMGSSAAILHRTSADGIIWSVPDTALVAGSASDWDPNVWNTCLWQDEAGVWYLFYDGFTQGNLVVPGGVGYASSDDPGGPWTKYAGNPVITSTTAGFDVTPGFEGVLIEGGPSVFTTGGVNYMFFHGRVLGGHGSDTYRCSGGPNVWTLDSAVPVIPRMEVDEGPPPGTGQVADPVWVTDGTTQYLFASANTIGGQPLDEKIKLFTAPIVQVDYLGLSADIAALIADLNAVLLKTNTLGGAGAITWPYTLTESDNTPISDADVWVTTDEAGNNVVASGRTDASGVVTFFLDAGIVYVWAQKTGWNFTNPDTESVVAP